MTEPLLGEKFSQLPPAPTNPAATDQVVGLAGHTTVQLFALQQVAHTVEADFPSIAASGVALISGDSLVGVHGSVTVRFSIQQIAAFVEADFVNIVQSSTAPRTTDLLLAIHNGQNILYTVNQLGQVIGGSGGGGSGTLTINATPVEGGVAGRILYDDGATLQEAVLGSGLALSAGTMISTATLIRNSTQISGGAPNQLLYDNGGTLQEATVGSGLSFTGGNLALAFSTSLTVHATPIVGGAASKLLYDNGGRLEEAALGSGLSLVGGTLTTPVMPRPVNIQTASYILALSDMMGIVEMNVGSGNSVTIPPNSAVAFPVGTEVDVLQKGVGATTFVAGVGVTILSASVGKQLLGQYYGATLIQDAPNVWVLQGALGA